MIVARAALSRGVPARFAFQNPILAIQRSRFNTSNVTRDADNGKPTLQVDAFARSQRLGRPRSPHLDIYQPQLTWVMSGAFRVTVVPIGLGFYALSALYGIVPFDSGALASAIHSLPGAAILLGKAAVAFPATYHALGGIRHLLWDTGSNLTIPGVYRSGYVVLAGTVLIGSYLCTL
ncbi:uncharacterized protein BJ171DRAFT_489518 [Polychytrium aggregatum]|uniref:uncharacterized protein n=1 Tax=Polychytrium aggregatum TaxID=110093 RepID=UPI0022FE9807|nr:uncharacterized protein BJ171DRAFT_489518 [Polychytrium aggregatum]KAI9208612.1 hypothetical protein BJ171DRAFT_489518 [Polychytrium aggregatum]